jgi:hypothetical protein
VCIGLLSVREMGRKPQPPLDIHAREPSQPRPLAKYCLRAQILRQHSNTQTPIRHTLPRCHRIPTALNAYRPNRHTHELSQPRPRVKYCLCAQILRQHFNTQTPNRHTLPAAIEDLPHSTTNDQPLPADQTNRAAKPQRWLGGFRLVQPGVRVQPS